MKEGMLFWQTLVEDINFTVKIGCLYATLFAHNMYMHFQRLH